jgi:hypothetical protein
VDTGFRIMLKYKARVGRRSEEKSSRSSRRPRRAPAADLNRGNQILIVDDGESMRDLLATIMS